MYFNKVLYKDLLFFRVLQSPEVSSSSDHHVFGQEETVHFLTRDVVMGPYNQPSPYCLCRIYYATFNSTNGILVIKYCLDNVSHCYDPKSFLIDGYFVATYCLPSEEKILRDAFDSEPFLTWKNNQLQLQSQNQVVNQNAPQ